jgi:hypothetical protein
MANDSDEAVARAYWESLGTSAEMIERILADRERSGRPAAVSQVPKIQILREARQNGANRFEVVWWFRDGTKQRGVYTTVGWAERKVASVEDNGVWRTLWRDGKPAKFRDQVVNVEVGGWWAPSEHLRDCACGCGETFAPRRSDQVYASRQHKNRAKVRAFRERMRNPL